MTENEILDSLRAGGYRLTAPRRKLVDLLLRAEAPVTADEIYQRARRAKVDPDEKECPECTSAIPVKARRCPFCTSQLMSPGAAPESGAT